jgi:hypothetical protein
MQFAMKASWEMHGRFGSNCHLNFIKASDFSLQLLRKLSSRWNLTRLILVLKMEMICSSETSADLQRTTRRYTPHYSTVLNHRCENLKPHIANILCLHMANRKVRKWQGGTVTETEAETSFLKFTSCVTESNEATFCTVHLLWALSQPDLQSVERKKKTNRSISCIWLVVVRLVTKQISTTRWPRLHLESISRSIQLLTYFCAVILSLKLNTNFTPMWSKFHMNRCQSKRKLKTWQIHHVCLHFNHISYWF